MGAYTKIGSISIDLSQYNDMIDVGQCEHFSLRGYVSGSRKKNWKLCWPFLLNESNEQPSFPPLDVPKFKRWSCESCQKKSVGESIDGNDQIDANICNIGHNSNYHARSPICSSKFQQASRPNNILEGNQIDLDKSLDLSNNVDCILTINERESNDEGESNGIIDNAIGLEDNHEVLSVESPKGNPDLRLGRPQNIGVAGFGDEVSNMKLVTPTFKFKGKSHSEIHSEAETTQEPRHDFPSNMQTTSQVLSKLPNKIVVKGNKTVGKRSKGRKRKVFQNDGSKDKGKTQEGDGMTIKSNTDNISKGVCLRMGLQDDMKGNQNRGVEGCEYVVPHKEVVTRNLKYKGKSHSKSHSAVEIIPVEIQVNKELGKSSTILRDAITVTEGDNESYDTTESLPSYYDDSEYSSSNENPQKTRLLTEIMRELDEQKNKKITTQEQRQDFPSNTPTTSQVLSKLPNKMVVRENKIVGTRNKRRKRKALQNDRSKNKGKNQEGDGMIIESNTDNISKCVCLRMGLQDDMKGNKNRGVEGCEDVVPHKEVVTRNLKFKGKSHSKSHSAVEIIPVESQVNKELGKSSTILRDAITVTEVDNESYDTTESLPSDYDDSGYSSSNEKPQKTRLLTEIMRELDEKKNKKITTQEQRQDFPSKTPTTAQVLSRLPNKMVVQGNKTVGTRSKGRKRKALQNDGSKDKGKNQEGVEGYEDVVPRKEVVTRNLKFKGKSHSKSKNIKMKENELTTKHETMTKTYCDKTTANDSVDDATLEAAEVMEKLLPNLVVISDLVGKSTHKKRSHAVGEKNGCKKRK